MTSVESKCALLFSGGTDSTCAVALMAESFSEIHLLTFYELGTKNSPLPRRNVELLQKRFPNVRFVQVTLSTDALVKKISYHRYGRSILRHGFFVLSTPGFSSLSWHSTMVAYCLEHRIKTVADGLTRELMHFPGHMDKVIGIFRGLYKKFGIEYLNPVREWEVPPDQQFLDRLIVGRHGFFVDTNGVPGVRKKTTGEYLFSLGIFPNANVKGTEFDQAMQHDCYPFVLYNILVFWLFLPFSSPANLEIRIEKLMHEKTADCERWLRDGTVRLTP